MLGVITVPEFKPTREDTSPKRHHTLHWDIFGVGMARNEAQRWEKIWFGQSRNGARAGMGTSFIRHLAAVLGCSSMKSSFQI